MLQSKTYRVAWQSTRTLYWSTTCACKRLKETSPWHFEHACHANRHKEVMMLDNPHHFQSFSSVRSHVKRLAIGRPSTGVTSSYVQTRNADPYTQTRVRPCRELVDEFTILAELFWQNWCGRLLSSNEFDQQLYKSMHSILQSRVASESCSWTATRSQSVSRATDPKSWRRLVCNWIALKPASSTSTS